MQQRGRHGGTRLRYVIVLVATAVLTYFVLATGLVSSHPVQVNKARIVASASSKFTPEQLDGAFAAVKDSMNEPGFNGCTLTQLRYDEKKSNDLLLLEKGSAALDPQMPQTIYIFSDFVCDLAGGDGSLNTGHGGFTYSVRFDGATSGKPQDWTVLSYGNA